MLRLLCGVLLMSSAGAFGCGDDAASGGGIVVLQPGPTCMAFCEKAEGECEAYATGEAVCVQTCEQDLAGGQAASEACGDAIEVALQCATELDCQAILDRLSGEQPLESYPCRSEVEDVDEICQLT